MRDMGVGTLKGTILCAKCELKETKECTTAIQVKEGGKTVTYYFDDKGDDDDRKHAFHGLILRSPSGQKALT